MNWGNTTEICRVYHRTPVFDPSHNVGIEQNVMTIKDGERPIAFMNFFGTQRIQIRCIIPLIPQHRRRRWIVKLRPLGQSTLTYRHNEGVKKDDSIDVVNGEDVVDEEDVVDKKDVLEEEYAVDEEYIVNEEDVANEKDEEDGKHEMRKEE